MIEIKIKTRKGRGEGAPLEEKNERHATVAA